MPLPVYLRLPRLGIICTARSIHRRIGAALIARVERRVIWLLIAVVSTFCGAGE